MVQYNKQAHQPLLKRNLNPIAKTGYQVQLSEATEDPMWDSFLAQTPGGHHVQTSLWARVKALLGWRAVRIVITRSGHIVAGAQILMRPLPVVGFKIGYVAKGPLLAEHDPGLIELVINELKQAARTYRIQNLAVLPPDCGAQFAQQLPDQNFQPGRINIGVDATVKIDLRSSLEDILAQMKSKTRYNIRLGQRKGITVRQGSESDLPIFYQSLLATGRRQNFTPYPKEYFTEMWRILEPYGYIKLFLAEYQNEILSTLLAIPFGDTVIYKKGTWGGHQGNRRPNEVMHWAAIQWAKSQSYSYYDLEGIDRRAAKQLLQDESLATTMLQTTTRFKLGFGGQVFVLPSSYEYIYNPLLRWSNDLIYPKITNWPALHNALAHLHKR